MAEQPFDPREPCPGCGWLLPVYVAAADCMICITLAADADDRRCCCGSPLRLRLYLGEWLCVCGGLVR